MSKMPCLQPRGSIITNCRRNALKTTINGFTLIELAVVLFIVTLVLGGIMQFVTAQVANAKITNTRSKQDAIKTALVNFIARNNRLPCPAIPTIPSGTAGEGLEAPTVGGVPCVGATGSDATLTTFNIASPLGSTPIVATGEVPWATLGLSHEVSLDGYANRFTYQVTWAATQLTPQTIAGMTGAITLHDSAPVSDGASSATPPGNQNNDCRPNKVVAYVPAANPCSAVIVILSHGPDGYGAYTDGGIQIPFPLAGTLPAPDERENADQNQKFVAKSFSDSTTNPFDDMLFALTSSDLLSQLTNTAVLQDARAAINLSFNQIKSTVSGSIAGSMTITPTPTALTDAQGNSCTLGTPTTTPPNSCTYYSKYNFSLPPATFPTGFTVERNGVAGVSFTAPFSCTPAPCVQNRALVATIFTNLANSQARYDPWGSEIQYILFNAAPTQTLTNPEGTGDASSNIAYRLLSIGADKTPNTVDDIWIDVSFGEIRQQIPSR